MVRSRWIKAFVLALASAGLVRGQTPGSPFASSSGPAKAAAVVPAVATTPAAPMPQATTAEPPKLMPTPAPVPGEVYISVQEAGKPEQRCKVLKTWKMEDGSIASQVQSVDTGEIMTIVEDATGPVSGSDRVRDVASRIFHWGRGTPSSEVPMPPETEIVYDERPTVGDRVKGAFSKVFHKPGGRPGMEGEVIVGPTHEPPQVVNVPSPPRSWPSAHTTRPAEGVYGPSEVVGGPVHKVPTHPHDTPSKPSVVSSPAPSIPLADHAKAKPSDWRSSWGKPEATPVVTVKKETPKPTGRTEVPPPPPVVSKVELPQADKKKPDPLKSPTEYNPKTMSDVTLNKPTEKPSADVPAALAPASKEVAGGVPLGAQSVLQSGTTNYVPVPIVTLPGMNQPVGPTGRPPQPPQLNAKLNAFTNVPTPPAPVDTPADMVNAFTPAQQTPNPEAVAANGAFGQGHAMPAAALPYPPPGYQQRAMMARGMVPMPGGYQPAGYPYGQPMPGYGPQQPGYAHVAHPGYQVAMVPPATERVTPPGPTSVPQLAGVLKESMYPSQREWAAMRLADYNGHTQPAAVEALTRAAREDPAAIVRAACVRSLARMGVTTQVAATLQACTTDADPRVQQEATLALQGQPSAQPIQQTGRKVE